MSSIEYSHVRHEICIANDTTKAVCSIMLRKGLPVPPLLKQVTEKLDNIIEYLDGLNNQEEILVETQSEPCRNKESGNLDAVLVDDDALILASWKLQAKAFGKELVVYGSAEDLLKDVASLNPKTPIYIDHNLGKQKMQGMALVEKLFDSGFRELYISTGMDHEVISKSDKVKEVRGKNPPWGL